MIQYDVYGLSVPVFGELACGVGSYFERHEAYNIVTQPKFCVPHLRHSPYKCQMLVKVGRPIRISQ